MARPRIKNFVIKSVSLSTKTVEMLEALNLKDSFSNLVEMALIDKFSLHEDDSERRQLAIKLAIAQENIAREREKIKQIQELLEAVK